MRIAVGSDHEGFPQKDAMVEALQADGHAVLDLGTFSEDPVDYPDFARAIANAVRNKFVDLGVLLCGSGSGASIAANKVRGIRAAAVHNDESARLSRSEDDANVICLASRTLDAESAVALAHVFVDTPFSNEERHVRRVAKIIELESGLQRGGDSALRVTATPSPAGAKAAPAGVPATPPPAAHQASATPQAREPRTAGATVAVTAAVAARPPSASSGSTESSPSGPPSPPATPSGPVAERRVSAADLVGPRLGPSRSARATADGGAVGEATATVASPNPSLEALVREAVLSVGEEPARDAATVGEGGGSLDTAPPPPVDGHAHLPDQAIDALKQLEAMEFGERVWVKDASLWSDSSDLQASIRNRLGWLTSPTLMREYVSDLKAFATEIRRLGFSNVLLLGVGGASLAAEVMSAIFGAKVGYPDLVVVDSAEPTAVKGALGRVQLARTLFIVSSKSGSTADVIALYRFFRSQADTSKLPKPGQHFIAITDPGSPLEKLAKDASFRRTFLNHPSIGGRFSALSFFGLVPAALLGIDVDTLLERASEMVAACGDSIPVRDNPALSLGALLAGVAREGRNKVTLVLSERLRPFGPWLEQLLGESTGKDAKGLVPVDGEPLGPPTVYGSDRAFVALALAGEPEDARLGAIVGAGHPVHRITLRDPYDLGAEFFRWELAVTAVASLLGVNPFDEPEVVHVKEAAEAILSAYKKTKRLADWPVDREEDGLQLVTNLGTKPASVGEGLGAFLRQAQPGDYVAILAYLPRDPETTHALQALRSSLRDRLGVATTVGYGPRYVHTTGQLHRGGPPTVLILQLTSDDREELMIPGEGYGFATLRAAHALADLETLRKAGRRVIRLQLTGRLPTALTKVIQAVDQALA